MLSHHSASSRKPQYRGYTHNDQQGISEEDICNHVGSNEDKRQIIFQVDTGATCNVERSGDIPAYTKIEPTKQILSIFNSNTLVPQGQCQRRFRNPNDRKRYKGAFIVLEEGPTSNLGASAVQQMGPINIRNSKIYSYSESGVSASAHSFKQARARKHCGSILRRI